MKVKIILYIAFFLQLLSCERRTDYKIDEYNRKSNELILQIAQESNCDCIIEISHESLIEIVKLERPNYGIEKFVIKSLDLKSKSELDSLVNLSEKFKLDTTLMKNSNINIISPMEIREVKNDNGKKIFTKCNKGILWATKPILNKHFNMAIIDCGLAFMCVRGPIWIYQFKNNKWNNLNQ